MAERLMGIETEYAINGLTTWGGTHDQSDLLNRFMGVARGRLVHLPDVASGLFLGNGSRFYVDYGNHPELGTPECANPWDVVRYILAGERILADLATAMKRELAEVDVLLFKSNVDYGEAWVTWGCHESYMHRAATNALSDDIIPHLVTRTIYTGAGGFNSLSRGLEFTLSPRVPHLANVVSNNSTSDRGIFHTKDESLSKPGFHRLHIICGESLCSETAMWLKVGTTALVVAMSEAGLRPGHGVGLRAPLQAMQTIASDPSCAASVEMSQGRHLSAIEIQYHYLTLAERNLDYARMPSWAPDVCREWRAMLNRLLDAPESVATTLDWAIKRAMYAKYANDRGVDWESLPYWTYALTSLRHAHDLTEDYGQPFTADFILQKRSPISPIQQTVQRLTPFLAEHGLSWDALDAVIAVRKELFEVDTRFGQLGERGIFSSLHRAGVLTHHVPGVESIDDAMTRPPTVGRARIRGEVIRRLAGRSGYQCDWQGVVDVDLKRVLDLSEPFEEVERWLDFDQARRMGPPVFADLLMRLSAGAGAPTWR
ncbi:MAG: proteasome accessory factor PafA2 family protein [Acidobacteriota bacterium]